ncbi:S-adenosyl-L-methionine-dependent methyltransferase [Gongronella butleri]|nr:S-adenosyl-L-methionine-dependent methyltransferase [Gongronella butleri]
MFKFIQSFLGHSRSAMSTNNVLHRVKVVNLPTRESAAIKKFFQAHEITKFKKAPQWNYAYLTFASEEEATAAMRKLNGQLLKKYTIGTEYSQIKEDEFRNRFQARAKAVADSASDSSSVSSVEEQDNRTPAERLLDQVTPLHALKYEDQLQKKHKQGIRHIRNLRKKLAKLPGLTDEGKNQLTWVFEDRKEDEPPCTIEDAIGSPEIYGYRTKCEFSIGKDLNGDPSVGFLLGSYRDGVTTVIEPSATVHVPDTAKAIAASMEAYVKQSAFPVYDRVARTGVWRTLMVKAQHTGEVMMVIQMRTLDLTPQQVEQEKQRLVAYWQARHKVTTLLLQQWNGDSNGMTERGDTQVLIGTGYVHEKLLGYKFRISSSAFFQVNTAATEKMYQKCAEWCNFEASQKATTLLDLCCGCGSIGITVAKNVDRVIGIEMISDAIDDARYNAQLNHVTNVQYYANKVEEKIDIVSNERNEDVVAVLDPPRSGVHNSVIMAVRGSPQIQKVIYISCDAKQAMQNFIALCRPTSNRYQGIPFKPKRAITIDLFPHTDHAELMIEFERIQ